MRDYSTEYQGRETKISDLPTDYIVGCLADGVQSQVSSVTETAIRDRLELELFIREKGLRANA